MNFSLGFAVAAIVFSVMLLIFSWFNVAKAEEYMLRAESTITFSGPNEMTFSEYQRQAKRTMPKNKPELSNIIMLVFGSLGELGETVELIKKNKFHGHKLNKDKLKKEIGDQLWYLTNTAEIFELSMDEIARDNITKLRIRYPDRFSEKHSINRIDLRG
jgi:NTP pyrophosphatase (non-canonical NTP hydrolase)